MFIMLVRGGFFLVLLVSSLLLTAAMCVRILTTPAAAAELAGAEPVLLVPPLPEAPPAPWPRGIFYRAYVAVPPLAADCAPVLTGAPRTREPFWVDDRLRLAWQTEEWLLDFRRPGGGIAPRGPAPVPDALAPGDSVVEVVLEDLLLPTFGTSGVWLACAAGLGPAPAGLAPAPPGDAARAGPGASALALAPAPEPPAARIAAAEGAAPPIGTTAQGAARRVPSLAPEPEPPVPPWALAAAVPLGTLAAAWAARRGRPRGPAPHLVTVFDPATGQQLAVEARRSEFPLVFALGPLRRVEAGDPAAAVAVDAEGDVPSMAGHPELEIRVDGRPPSQAGELAGAPQGPL